MGTHKYLMSFSTERTMLHNTICIDQYYKCIQMELDQRLLIKIMLKFLLILLQVLCLLELGSHHLHTGQPPLLTYDVISTSTFRSSKLGELLGCPTSDPADLEACMQQADASQMAMMQYGAVESGSASTPFIPIIDGVFIPDTIEVCIILI